MPEGTTESNRAAGLTCTRLTRAPWFRCDVLTLARGEVAVLRGPTGAGKSLFLRALADLDPVDAGEVELDGQARTSWSGPEWRRRVLYVHPGGIRTAGTVAQNLERVAQLAVHGGRALGSGALPGGSQADQLSTGEGQLLALERAFGIDPQVLLLDEPTTGLDPSKAREIEARALSFAEGGRVVLWVSHDEHLADRLHARLIEWADVMVAP